MGKAAGQLIPSCLKKTQMFITVIIATFSVETLSDSAICYLYACDHCDEYGQNLTKFGTPDFLVEIL
jgi:hypothetical protein